MKREKFSISDNCDISGVYIILNLKNYKCYIGSSRNIKRRLHEHEIALRNARHKNEALQEDYDNGCKFIAYPLSEVKLLEPNYRKDDNLRYYENEAIKLFESTNPQKGYNTNTLGTKMSAELSDIYRKKVSLQCFINSVQQRNSLVCKNLRDRNRKTQEFIETMLKGA